MPNFELPLQVPRGVSKFIELEFEYWIESSIGHS